MDYFVLWGEKQKVGYMLVVGAMVLYAAYGISYQFYKTVRPDPPEPPQAPLGIRWLDGYLGWLEKKRNAGKWWTRIVEEWSGRLALFVIGMCALSLLMAGGWIWESFVKLTPPFGVRAIVVCGICSIGYALFWVRENWQQGYATIEFAVAVVSAWKAVAHYPENGGMMSQVAWLQVMAAVYLVVRARDNWEKGKTKKATLNALTALSTSKRLIHVDVAFAAVMTVGILVAVL